MWEVHQPSTEPPSCNIGLSCWRWCSTTRAQGSDEPAPRRGGEGDLVEVRMDLAGAVAVLEATTAMAFPLGRGRLDHVVDELSGSRVPAATQFRTQYLATRPKTEPPSPSGSSPGSH